MNNLESSLSIEWFKAMLDAIHDGVIVINSKGMTLYVNSAVVAIFGYNPDELIGKTLEYLMPERYRDSHKTSMLKAADDHIDHNHHVIGKTVEMYALHKDRSEFPIELSLTEKRVDDKYYFIGVIRDITERVRIRTELDTKIKELEKVNALMVGRELKMVELKKEIERLNTNTSNAPQKNTTT